MTAGNITACSAKTPDGHSCPMPWAGTFLVACGNGHQRQREACAFHALAVLTGQVGCWDCLTGDPRADVGMAVVEVLAVDPVLLPEADPDG